MIQYDRLLSIANENRNVVFPLESLFQQSSDNKSRSNFVIVDRMNIKNLKNFL